MALASLSRKRGAAKRAVTSFLKLLDEVDAEVAADPMINPSRKQLLQISDKLIHLKGVRTKFDTVQDEIEETCELADLQNQEIERTQFDDGYYDVITRAQQYLDDADTGSSISVRSGHGSGTINSDARFEVVDNLAGPNEAVGLNQDIEIRSNASEPINGGSNHSLNHSIAPQVRVSLSVQLAANNRQVQLLPDPQAPLQIEPNLQSGINSMLRLPTIQIPKYSGEPAEWLEFKNTFKSLIHENASLNDMQRYHFLKSSLHGEALALIQSLPITEQHYGIAWEAVCSNFDIACDLVHEHIKAIFNLERSDKESASKIKGLINEVSKHLRALESLGEHVESWDSIIIYLMCYKLDPKTFRDWETHKVGNRVNFELFKSFLRARASLLEKVEQKQKPTGFHTENKGGKRSTTNVRALHNVSENNKVSCNYCEGNHYLYKCEKFKALLVRDRIETVKRLNLCFNCLRAGHGTKNCKGKKCQTCNSGHNTLLHLNTASTNSGQTGVNRNSDSNDQPGTSQVHNYFVNERNSYVLLATVLANVKDSQGTLRQVRILLDGCSQSSFITKNCCQRLNLELRDINVNIIGLNDSTVQANGSCDVELTSTNGAYKMNLSCIVVSKISGKLPSVQLDVTKLKVPPNVRLADPEFGKPGPVDVLIGATHYLRLMSQGQIELGDKLPVLQKTKFGWIVSGAIIGASGNTEVQTFKLSVDLQKELEKFWTIEECLTGTVKRGLGDKAEALFVETYNRCNDGRFIATIPLSQSVDTLGDSKTLAVKRFLKLEERLDQDRAKKEMYQSFLYEYEKLGHMSWCNFTVNDIEGGYYMPHHGVYREQAVTTKLRVVFDASAATTTGVSFNNIQIVGPTIQDDLFAILIRFRKHNFVVSADIEKMYRQVLVDPSQRKYQKIVWRSDKSFPMSTYQLNTVTYGTASAPFLAIRSLYQLAIDVESEKPELASVIKHDFYVDDMLTGFESKEEAKAGCEELSRILKSGQFVLHKWLSNDASILEHLVGVADDKQLNLSYDTNVKTLGLGWSVQKDCLIYNIHLDIGEGKRVTKRTILSVVSRIFDPLGLLCPFTINAKLLMQSLWKERLTWDELVPLSIANKFLQFVQNSSLLRDFIIPRQVIFASSVEIHGFCDASERAYGACIYIASNKDGVKCSRLMCAKSKVAPLKTLTIPKLELCGALLLSRLVVKVKGALKFGNLTVNLWTDSTIVLGWIKLEPSLLKIFVGNRVAEIQTLTPDAIWRHVRSTDNPADLVSRGTNAKVITDSVLWSQGPSWLTHEASGWPLRPVEDVELPELRIKAVACSLGLKQDHIIKFNSYSSYSKLIRVFTYCKRFVTNVRLSNRDDRKLDGLTSTEIRDAELLLARVAQLDSFGSRLEIIQEKYRMLNPFMHSDGVIRVGGRLSNANIGFNQKHPILLDGKHHLALLIFKYEHIRHLHAGPQLLLSLVRQKFWVTQGRNLAKRVVSKCTTCFHVSPRMLHPIMGELPANKVIPSPPFFTTGVDYAGPFKLRDRRGRGFKIYKAYICIFICFVTKAIHVELVSDLSAEGFILTLRKFVSRRGRPHQIVSDNGTNFVGANRVLQELADLIHTHWNTIETELAMEGITWKFIPPYSPHLGGLWEAGVKSVKAHLKRVAGESLLTFEELYGLLVQVEAIVNSRPLYAMSSDPNDVIPLTPAHFLVGRSLTSVPDENLDNVKLNRLNRFQLVQRLQQQFWKQWSREYLCSLQQRPNVKNNGSSIKCNDLVLLRDENHPPLQWKLARVVELHKGQDGVTRVVSVKVGDAIVKRAVKKVCPLPTYDE